MSYETLNDGGLTPLEHAAGLWNIMYGNDGGECSCGDCPECVWRRHNISKEQKEKLTERKLILENSVRFKDAAKLVAGLSGNRGKKLALIQKVHQDSLDLAIVRYMSAEALPDYYASIVKSRHCIDRLLQGIFYKVCKIEVSRPLDADICELCNSLRNNPSRITAYDRVTLVQLFIHRVADQRLGAGAAQAIPVVPMKNTLSAIRLHLSILDITDHGPSYASYIDALSTAATQLEYDEPRPSTAPWGKRSWPKWRVRHMRPLSHYFSKSRIKLIKSLRNLDENDTPEQFTYNALLIYADA